MPEYDIPLSRPRSHDYDPKEIGDMFAKLSSIPRQYFEDILDDFNTDYKVVDKVAVGLIRSYLDSRLERNDDYFKCLTDIHARFFSGKALIHVKKK